MRMMPSPQPRRFRARGRDGAVVFGPFPDFVEFGEGRAVGELVAIVSSP